ncbi:efflux RND transporter permease subunit [Rhodobacteraceae bacterium SC52]|nr:efflux RND transporter permease subunit [Rhodobacteraceae bacterium SC52]
MSQSSGTVIETNLPADGTVQAGEGSVRFGSRAEALHLKIAEAELQQARDTATPWLFNALIDTQVALIKDIPTPYPDTGDISDVPGVQASARSTNSLNIRGAGRGLQVAVKGTNNDEMTEAVDTLMAAMANGTAFVNPQLSNDTVEAQFEVTVDPDMANVFGLTGSEITSTVSAMVQDVTTVAVFIDQAAKT